MDSIGGDCTFEKEHDMAGSPISQQAQYADDYLTTQILGPRVQFLVDNTTFDALGSIYWAMPIQGRIVKIKAVTETQITCPGTSVTLNTAPLGASPVFTQTLGNSTGGTSNAGDVVTANYKDNGSQGGVNYAADSVMQTSVASVKSSTVTIDDATPGLVHWAAHGLVATTKVVFSTTGTLPAPLVAGTTYYVIAAGLVAGAFEISATSGGAAINTTTAGSGTHTATANPPPTAGAVRVEVTIEPNYS